MPRVLVIAGFLAALAAAGCHRAPTPGGASGSKPDQARKQAESLALSAVNSAAEAQGRAIPSLVRKGGSGLIDKAIAIAPGAATSPVSAKNNPSVDPRPNSGAPTISTPKEAPQPIAPPRAGSTPIIRDRIVSVVPYVNEADADADAINVACELVQRRFAELDPPVKYRPSANEMKNEFLRRDSRSVRQLSEAEKVEFAKNGIMGNLVYVEYDVEVTPEQVRQLRTRDRIGDAVRVFGALAVVALAGFLFLRADEWTKGYLTSWLAAGAVVIAGGAAAALYFV